ncbi:MAG: hypothetical protein IID31_10055 [Planctomycetes bacterium]|nr:hypothetical protein [Planctomycetota bacterium]
MASTGWDWIFHALGWALAAAGLLLALWALFWDRSRGRKRCPKCWYSMEGAAQGEGGRYTCPECGKVIADDRTLHRTRRRPRRVVISLMVWIVGYAVFVTPAVRRDGWVAVIPTSVLIVIASPERIKELVFTISWSTKVALDYGIESELIRRGEEQSIHDWQADFLAWRIRRASVDPAGATEFKSYDISRLLSPSWWRSSIPFSSDDRAQLWTELHYLWFSLAIPDSWVANGGNSAAMTRMGNRFYVWAPLEQQRIVALNLALLITDGKEENASAPYWLFDEELRSRFETRIYDVSDLAPPNVERFKMPPPDPNADVQWGYFDGELMLHSQGIFDLIDDIVDNVESDYWVENGGEDATISTVPGRLIITVTPEMHERVAQRLELLRNARKSETAGSP